VDDHRSAAGQALRLTDGHRGWSGRSRGPRGCGFGPHRRAGGNGNGQRLEGARGGSGDRCGVTKGTEMREGGEQQVRCGEAEAGACFIGPGRRWGGGEAADGGGVLILIDFDGVKGGEEIGWHRFSGGVKAVRWHFGSAPCARRRAAVSGAGHRWWWLCRTN
jgi:hypothetical protein